jgi:hypothetical protein
MAGSRGRNKVFGQGTPLGRLLSVVLLCLLGYGATAEAVHKHGGIAPARAAESSVRFESQGADSDAKTFVNENDCTLCQLQRNLFAGLLYAPLRIVVPDVPARRTPTLATSYLFALRTSQRGRAPPVTL